MTDKKFENQIERIDRAIHRLFHLAFHQNQKQTGDMSIVASGDMHIIELAYSNPDMILKEIRDRLNLPQTTLSSRIAKLEKQDLIKRVINHRDMRSFSLEVTEKGKKMFEGHKEFDYHLAKEGLLSLDEDEREHFIEMLEKVIKRFSS